MKIAYLWPPPKSGIASDDITSEHCLPDKKQGGTSTSTPEAELVALADFMKGSALRSMSLRTTILGKGSPLVVYEDNEAAAQSKFKAMRHVLRHHGVRLGFLHDCWKDGQFELRNCDPSVMGADIFIKLFLNPINWESATRLVGIRKPGKIALANSSVVTLEPSPAEPIILKSALNTPPTSPICMDGLPYTLFVALKAGEGGIVAGRLADVCSFFIYKT